MKIKQLHQPEIMSKIGHKFLSFFVIFSLVFNPLFHHIPVAEATVPAVPPVPSLKDGQDDSRSAYTAGESDNKIKLKDTTIRGCAVSGSLVTVYNLSDSDTALTDTSGNSTVIANGIDCDEVSTDGEYSFRIGKSDLIVGSNSITVTATDPAVPEDVSSDSPALILDVDDSVDITSSELSLSTESRATIKGLTVTITATTSDSNKIGFYASTGAGDSEYKLEIVENTARESYGVKTETDGSQTKDTDNANTAIAPTAGNPRFSHDNNPNPFILVYTDGQTNEQIVDDIVLASQFLDDGNRFEITDNGSTFDIFEADEDIKNIDTYSIRESGGFTATTAAATKSSEKVSDTRLPVFQLSNVEANSVVELYLWEDTNTDTYINDNELGLLGLKEETTGSSSTITVKVGDDISNYAPSVSGATVREGLITDNEKKQNIVTKIVDAVGNISDISDITNIQIEITKTDTPTSVTVDASDIAENDTDTGFPVITSANNESITITGTTEAGNTVYVRNGTELLASKVASSSTFSIDVSLEGDETYQLSITIIKPGKLESDAVLLDLIVISVGPTLLVSDSSLGQPSQTKDFTFEIENLDTSTEYEDRSPTDGYAVSHIELLNASDACNSETFTDTNFETNGGVKDAKYITYKGDFTAGESGNNSGWSSTTNYGIAPTPLYIDVAGNTYNWRAFEYNKDPNTLTTFISVYLDPSNSSDAFANIIDEVDFRFETTNAGTIHLEKSFDEVSDPRGDDGTRIVWKFEGSGSAFITAVDYTFSVFNSLLNLTYNQESDNGKYLCARTEDRFGNETIVRQEVKGLDFEDPTGYFIKSGFDTAGLQRYTVIVNDNYPNFSVKTTNGTEITADRDDDCLGLDLSNFTELTDLSVPVKGAGTDATNKQKVCLMVVDAAGNRIDRGTGTAGNVIDGAYNVTLASEDISYTDAQTGEVYINKTTGLSFSANTSLDDAEVSLYIVDDGAPYIDPVAADLTATASGGVVTFADLDLSSFDDHDGKKNIFASTNTDHNIRYKIMDLILDTQAPQVPGTPTLVPGSDSFYPNSFGTDSDNITKGNSDVPTKISISGCAEADADVIVLIGAASDALIENTNHQTTSNGEDCTWTPAGGTEQSGKKYTFDLLKTDFTTGDNLQTKNYVAVQTKDLANTSDSSGILEIFVDDGVSTANSVLTLPDGSAITDELGTNLQITNIEKDSIVELYAWLDADNDDEKDSGEVTLISIGDTKDASNDDSTVTFVLGTKSANTPQNYEPIGGLTLDSNFTGFYAGNSYILYAYSVDAAGNSTPDAFAENSIRFISAVSIDKPFELNIHVDDYDAIDENFVYIVDETDKKIRVTGLTRGGNHLRALIYNDETGSYDNVNPSGSDPVAESSGAFTLDFPATEFATEGKYILNVSSSSDGTNFEKSNRNIFLTIKTEAPTFFGYIETVDNEFIDTSATIEELAIQIVELDETIPTIYEVVGISAINKNDSTITLDLLNTGADVSVTGYEFRGDSFTILTGANSINQTNLASATLPIVATVKITDILGRETTVDTIYSYPELTLSINNGTNLGDQDITISSGTAATTITEIDLGLPGDNHALYDKCNIGNAAALATEVANAGTNIASLTSPTTKNVEAEDSSGVRQNDLRNLCFTTTDGTNTAYKSFIFDSTIPNIEISVTSEGIPAQEKTYSFSATDDSEPEYGFIYRHIVVPALDDNGVAITTPEQRTNYCSVTVPEYSDDDLETAGGLTRHDVSIDEATGDDLPIYTGQFQSEKKANYTGVFISSVGVVEAGSFVNDMDSYILFGGSIHAWKSIISQTDNNGNNVFNIQFFVDDANGYVGDSVDDTKIKITNKDTGTVHLDNYFGLSSAQFDTGGDPRRTVFKFTEGTALAGDDTEYNVEVYHEPVVFTDSSDNGKHLCVTTEDSFGNTAWELVEIQNIDVTDPTISVASPGTNKFLALSSEEGDMGIINPATATSDAECEATTDSYTSYTPYSEITTSDSTTNICFIATDIAGNTSYKYLKSDGTGSVSLISNITLYTTYNDANNSDVLALGTFENNTGITGASGNIIFTAGNAGNAVMTKFYIYEDGETDLSNPANIITSTSDTNGEVSFDTSDITFEFTEGEWDIYASTENSNSFPTPIKVFDLTVDSTNPSTPTVSLDSLTDTSRFGLTGGSSDKYTKNENINIIGCSEENATVNLVINDVSVTDLIDIADTDTVPNNGLVCNANEKKYEIEIEKGSTYLNSPTLTGSTNTIGAIGTDLAQNKSASSSTIDVVIDSGVGIDISSTSSIGIKDSNISSTSSSSPTFTISNIEAESIVELNLWDDFNGNNDGEKDDNEISFLGASAMKSGDSSVDVTVGVNISGYTPIKGGQSIKSALDTGDSTILVNIIDKAGNEKIYALSDYIVTYQEVGSEPTFLVVANANSSQQTSLGSEYTYYTNKTTGILLSGYSASGSSIKIYSSIPTEVEISTPETTADTNNAWSVPISLSEGVYNVYAKSTPSGSTVESGPSAPIFINVNTTDISFSPLIVDSDDINGHGGIIPTTETLDIIVSNAPSDKDVRWSYSDIVDKDGNVITDADSTSGATYDDKGTEFTIPGISLDLSNLSTYPIQTTLTLEDRYGNNHTETITPGPRLIVIEDTDTENEISKTVTVSSFQSVEKAEGDSSVSTSCNRDDENQLTFVSFIDGTDGSSEDKDDIFDSESDNETNVCYKTFYGDGSDPDSSTYKSVVLSGIDTTGPVVEFNPTDVNDSNGDKTGEVYTPTFTDQTPPADDKYKINYQLFPNKSSCAAGVYDFTSADNVVFIPISFEGTLTSAAEDTSENTNGWRKGTLTLSGASLASGESTDDPSIDIDGDDYDLQEIVYDADDTNKLTFSINVDSATENTLIDEFNGKNLIISDTSGEVFNVAFTELDTGSVGSGTSAYVFWKFDTSGTTLESDGGFDNSETYTIKIEGDFSVEVDASDSGKYFCLVVADKLNNTSYTSKYVDLTNPVITFAADSDLNDSTDAIILSTTEISVKLSVDEIVSVSIGGSCAASSSSPDTSNVAKDTIVEIPLIKSDGSAFVANTETYTDCTVRAEDVNTGQTSTITLQTFSIDTEGPAVPGLTGLTAATDAGLAGLSTNSDNITKYQDISATGCAEDGSIVFAYDNTGTSITKGSLTESTANGADCTWTPTGETDAVTGKEYEVLITSDKLSSDRNQATNTISVYVKDALGNEQASASNTITVEVDSGVVNFGDDVTISNSGSDYYISADDEDSSIKYSVTTEDKTSATTATCDNTLSYTDYDSTTGVSSLDSGVEKQICFEVEDSNSAILYYNSKTYEQDFPVLPSLDSVTTGNNSGDTTDNITNNTKPNILVSNVEGDAAVEIYTWDDTTNGNSDGLIQESELILRGFKQNGTSVGGVTVSWGSNSNTSPTHFNDNYVPTLTIDTDALSDGTYYFTSRVVDFVGNTSQFTPVSQVVINTQATDTITLEANTNIITTSTSGVNYINKTNLAKDADNNLVTLSNPSGLSDVGYADIQASTITCTDLVDTDFGNTDIPTTETTTLTDGSSYKVCARVEDSNGNAIYASFAFTLDTTEPSTPTLDIPADKAVSGLSTSSDGITEKGDITITGCALENTDVYAYIDDGSTTVQASTFTTANDTTTGCTDTDHDGYSLIISTSDLTSSRAGTESAITVSSFDDAGNESAKPTGFTFEIDDGVVNFGDDVTISNSGSDYYISADDEDSKIKYSVTTEDKTSTTTATCDNTLSYTDYDSTTGVSSLDSGVEKQICFEVEDSSLAKTYYNSKTYEQDFPVISSLDSASNSGDTTDNITNNTKPSILVSNVEGNAAVEIYTWSDDASADNLIQESELTLRGFKQNGTSVGGVTVSWGSNSNTSPTHFNDNYVPTLTIDTDALSDGTYYFTSRVVDFVGNTSQFTPVSQVVINTQATDTITLEANTNIITTSTSGVNYINKTNLAKDADNNLVTLSNPSGLSDVGYADIQASTITCTDLADTDFGNTDIPTTETTTLTDGSSYKVCARAEDSNGNAIYASFAFIIDITEPSTPTLDIPADKAVSGLSTSSDGITEKGDITITGCALENTDVYAYIDDGSTTVQASTFTTANDTTTGCTDTDHDGYSLIISTSDLTSSRAGTENAITVSSFDDAGNESGKPTGFTFEIDDGVVNFGDDVTISNSGSDYYISADDEDSTIKYLVTSSLVADSVVDCSTQTYTETYVGVGISNIVDNAGTDENRQICFEATDSSLVISHYNSIEDTQTSSVLPSLDSASNSGDTADNITNNTKPNILVSNVEGLAAVEIYTWSDDASADNLIQESELTLRGFKQNGTSVGGVTVSWGSNSNTSPTHFNDNYVPTLTIDTDALSDGTYYFTSRVVDFVGNTSQFTPVSQVVINTQATDTITLEANTNIITTSTSGVNYINKTNLAKDADNNLVTLSNPSGLSDVGYADIQASTITCTDLADTDFGNTDIPTTETTTLTDGSSYKVCARVEDSNGNAIYASFAFTLDTTEPSTPTVDTPTDKSVSGLSISSDGITEKGDITITGCALENTDVYAQITADSITTQASTFTTANDTTTGCTDTDHDGYSLIISTSDLTSSRAGTENAITVSSFDDAGNESGKPTGFTFEIDDGVVNFGDDVTISNSGSDYYISADDEDSSIKYLVTSSLVADSVIDCSAQTYTETYVGEGISNIVDNAGTDENRQICFEVTDSSLVISHYNSVEHGQTSSVISSLDSASNSGDTTDNITNNTKPNILVSNVEGNAAVEIYTWSDDASADNLIQESELTLRGFKQNGTSVGGVTVSWGSNSNTSPTHFNDNYVPTLTIDTDALSDGTYYFTSRVVDFVGNTSQFTPVSQVVINTQATDTITLEANTNIITTSTSGVNYINKTNLAKDADNNLVTLSNPSGLSNVGYADIQASTITCTDLADTDFGNTDIPTTETTTLTDGSSYKVCARAEDSNGNAIYASFAFIIDITEPSTPTLDIPADKAVSGLSTSSDGITEKGDITITGCALENTDVYAQITADSITTQASTFTTANGTTTGCTDTGHAVYSLVISDSDLTSSRAGTENAITVSSFDDAGNESTKPTGFTSKIDEGVVNFGDDVTISNSGSDYYISADDEDSSIKYSVTTEDKTSTTTATCDNTLSYTDYDSTTGVSSLDSGVEKQICFEVEDSNSVISYYNSKTYEQDFPVLPSLDSASNSGDTADNITNNTKPNILVSNVEGDAAVEIYTWDDTTNGNSDGLIQESELILRGFKQNGTSVGGVTVSWGSNSNTSPTHFNDNYVPTLTIDTTELPDETYYFTARAVDFVGNKSPFTPVSQVVINTQATTVNSIELSPNTYPSQFGSSELSDNITKESDIRLTVCVASGSTLTLKDELDTTINSTITEDTADTATCTVTGDSKFTIDITSGTLQSSPSGDTHNLHIDIENTTGTTSDGLNSANAQISVTLDSGVSNFTDIATISNKGTDYYITAYDEGSTINYFVTTEDKSSTTIVTCDSSLTYSNGYNGTGVSSLDSGVEKQICFEVTDSNITTPSVSYHNSKAAEQTPVAVSVNSGGYVTNDITPNITPTNIEEGAFVEVYTWSDDTSADGLVQASELTLHGVTQFTAGVTDVLWGSEVTNYTTSENKTIDSTDLVDNTTYKFVVRVVDLAGYVSSFTPPVDIKVDTAETLIEFTANTNLIYTNPHTSINYINKQGKNYSSIEVIASVDQTGLDLSSLKYSNLQSSTTDCAADLTDTDYSLSDPFTNDTSGGLFESVFAENATYIICAKALNLANTPSYASFVFTVDTTESKQVTSIDLLESSDSSRDAYPNGLTDNITNNTTLVFNVCAESDNLLTINNSTDDLTSILVTEDTTDTTTCTTQGDAKYDVTISASTLTSNQNSLYIDLTDSAGNYTDGSTTTIDVVLDTEVTLSPKPTLSLTSPNQFDSTKVNSSTPGISVSDVEANAVVELYQWKDEVQAGETGVDGVIQTNELILKSIQASTQSTSSSVDVVFGNTIFGYTTTTLKTINRDVLSGTDNKFTAIIVDAAGNFSTTDDVDVLSFDVEILGNPPTELYVDTTDYNTIYNNTYYTDSESGITIKGKGKAGETINVYKDADTNILGSTTIVNGQNKWEIDISLAVSDTLYKITATSEFDGEESSKSNPIYIYVDTTSPFTPDAVSIKVGDDTGRPISDTTSSADYYTTDNYTQSKDLYFNGCAEANSEIEIDLDDIILPFSATANGADCTDSNNNPGKEFEFIIEKEYFTTIKPVSNTGTNFTLKIISIDRSGNTSISQTGDGYLTLTLDSGTPTGFSRISLLSGYSSIVFVTNEKRPTFNITNIEKDSILELYDWDDYNGNKDGEIDQDELTTIGTVEATDTDAYVDVTVKYGDFVPGYTPTPGIAQLTATEISNGLSDGEYVVTATVIDKAGNIPNPKYFAASDFRIASIEEEPTGLSLHIGSYSTLQNHDEYFTNNQYINIRGYATYSESGDTPPVKLSQIKIYNDDTSSEVDQYICTSPSDTTTCTIKTDNLFVESNSEWNTYVKLTPSTDSYILYATVTNTTSGTESGPSHTLSINVEDLVPTPPTKPIVNSSHIEVVEVDGSDTYIYHSLKPVNLKGCAIPNSRLFVYLNKGTATPNPEIDALSIEAYADSSVVCDLDGDGFADDGLEYDVVIPIDVLRTDDYRRSNSFKVTSRTKGGSDSVPSDDTVVNIDSAVKGVSPLSTKRITASLKKESDSGSSNTDLITSNTAPKFEAKNVEARSYVELYLWSDLNDNNIPDDSDSLILVAEKESSTIFTESANKSDVYTVDIEFGNDEAGHTVEGKVIDSSYTLSDGYHNFAIQVVDKVENKSGYIPVPGTILIETKKPTAEVNSIGLTNNPILEITSTVDTDTTVSFVANTSCGFEASAENQLAAGAVLIVELVDPNLLELDDGTYDDCAIVLTSVVDVVSDDIAIPSFTVDTNPSTIAEETAITDPTNNPVVTISSTKDGTISFTGGCVPIENGIVVTDPDIIVGNNEIIFDTSGLTSGTTYTCVATVTDLARNTSNLTLSSFVFDNTLPELTEETAVTTPSTTTNQPEVVISSNEDGTLTFSGTAGCENNNTTGITASTNTTVTFDPLDDGTYDCIAFVTDGANNTSAPLNLTQFVVETTDPTVESTVLDGSGAQGTAFNILVSFSESVSNVDISDFEFIKTDNTDSSNPITSSAGTITKVEAFDELFGTSTGDIADDTTTGTISGQYFKVSVAATAGNITTTDIIFTFNTLSDTDTTKIIEDSAGNDIDLVNSGTNYTLEVAIDTSTTTITNATIVGSTLVLTSSIELNAANTTGGGGFSVTGSDSTAYTIDSVDVSGFTITITLDSNVAPTNKGTYSYDPGSTSALSVTNIHNVSLGIIENAEYKPDFTIDIDGSKSFTAASDAFFLYLYTQNQDGGVDITDGVLGQAIFGGVNNVLATKARVQAGIDGGYLDFDGSDSFTAASDAFFLYLYRQDQDGGVDITDGVLGQAIFGGVNNVEATKRRIDALIAAIPTE